MTAFHAAFSIALEGRFDDLWPHLAPDDRTLAALSVYRNTATKGRIDALEANYPTVVDMVGRDWFRAVAREYVEEEPGHDPVMAAYGDGFPAWLARFEPARPMAYLPPAARLDRAWTEAHLAEDAPTMTARQAASLGLALTGAPPACIRPRACSGSTGARLRCGSPIAPLRPEWSCPGDRRRRGC